MKIEVTSIVVPAYLMDPTLRVSILPVRKRIEIERIYCCKPKRDRSAEVRLAWQRDWWIINAISRPLMKAFDSEA